MYTKEVAIFMFTYNNKMLPASFESFLSVHRENHNYNTRKRDDSEIPMHTMKTNFTMEMSNQSTSKMPKIRTVENA